jgi:Glycosyl hydrolases family 8
MSWQIPSGGKPTGGQVNSASDADEDMAWALIMADKQWPGGTYLTAAKSLLMNLKSEEINSSNNVKDGNFNNAGSSHPDYAAPDYYKVFATVSGDQSWSSVYTAEYSQLTGAQNASTGLIPDALNGTGATMFGYDACRAPWRVGLDYCWSGSSSAKGFLSPMVGYLVQYASQNGGPMSVKIPISPLSGGAGQNVSGAITGPAAVGAMVSSSNQSFIDGSWSYLYNVLLRDSGSTSPNYFSSTMGLISMLALSGNFIDFTNPP